MKKYNIQITESALSDASDILKYIAYKLMAPDAAFKQYDRIIEAIFTLEYLPKRFKLVNFDEKSLLEVRRLLVDNYSVFFIIKDNDVIVTNIMYKARDIEARLKAFYKE